MSTVIIVVIVVLTVALTIYLSWYNSPKQKGVRGEKYVSDILSELPDEYIVLNDLVYNTERGTTQVDHVVVSKYGVFAIESKNYSGEIYGDDSRKEWTQLFVNKVTYRKKWWKTYTYVTKNRFYNPVKQSWGHVYKIKELLKSYPQLPVIPIVVFVGDVNIDKVESQNHVVYGEELCSVITDYNTEFIKATDVVGVCSVLQNRSVRHLVDNKTHVKNIKSAASKFENAVQSGVCPRCGGQLLERKGKYGKFYGCSNYPDCKFTAK